MTNISRWGCNLLGTALDMDPADIERLGEPGWHARVAVNLVQDARASAANISQLTSKGIGVLPVIYQTGSDGRFCSPRHPEFDAAEWSQRVAAFGSAISYGGGPKQVEVWNEPNAIQFWGQRADDAKTYVQGILSPAVESLKQYPAIAIVCGGLAFRQWVDSDGTYRAQRAEAYVQALCAAGGAPLVDRWSIHPYGLTNSKGGRVKDSNISAELAKEEIRRFRAKTNALNISKPIWVTETGLSVRRADFTEQTQLNFLRNLLVRVREAGGYGVTLWSNWPLRDPSSDSPSYYYSGLHRSNGGRRPAGEFWARQSS